MVRVLSRRVLYYVVEQLGSSPRQALIGVWQHVQEVPHVRLSITTSPDAPEPAPIRQCRPLRLTRLPAAAARVALAA